VRDQIGPGGCKTHSAGCAKGGIGPQRLRAEEVAERGKQLRAEAGQRSSPDERLLREEVTEGRRTSGTRWFSEVTKGSLGYLSSMYFSTSLVLGEVGAPFPEIESRESRTET